MKLWDAARNLWRKTPFSSPESPPLPQSEVGKTPLELAKQSLEGLVSDPRIPDAVRSALQIDYQRVAGLIGKLENEEIHLAAFGRVSVGKSALLNALLGEKRFSTSPLHGETTVADAAPWAEASVGGVHLIDMPGISEVDGEERETLAREAAHRCDLILFVADGDLTEPEREAAEALAKAGRPLILVLNKADRFTAADRETVLAALAERLQGVVPKERIIPAAANPAAQTAIMVDESGKETETVRTPPPDVAALKNLLWEILESEGKTLAALNAALFADALSGEAAKRMVDLKREAAEKMIRTYATGKGVAVAFNPVPAADLLSILADGALAIHLGRLYGIDLNPSEAGGVLKTILGQMMLLMGTVLGVQVAASAMKAASGGLSTVLTAGTQGAVAWYGTYVVGRAAERYFAGGGSWGEGGAKQAVREILDGLDQDSLMAQGKEEVLKRIKAG